MEGVTFKSIRNIELFAKGLNIFYLFRVVNHVFLISTYPVSDCLITDIEIYIIMSIFCQKYISNRIIETFHKSVNRNIASLLNLPKIGVIIGNKWWLKEKIYINRSSMYFTSFYIFERMFLTLKCPIQYETNVVLKTVFQNFVHYPRHGFLIFSGITPTVSFEKLTITININKKEIIHI